MRWTDLVVCVFVLIPSSAWMSGCESCSFTFGARTLSALVHVPVGYDDVQVALDSGLAGQIEWVSPGILEATWNVASESDGPRKCEFPGGAIEIAHAGCETERVEYDTIQSRHGSDELFETEVVLVCEPSTMQGQPGRWCRVVTVQAPSRFG